MYQHTFICEFEMKISFNNANKAVNANMHHNYKLPTHCIIYYLESRDKENV